MLPTQRVSQVSTRDVNGQEIILLTPRRITRTSENEFVLEAEVFDEKKEILVKIKMQE